MNCPNAGEIRTDGGKCIPVETFFSDGTNKVKWVDKKTGNDSNAGTKSNPWKTISRSTRSGVLSPGDAVIIRGGTYRETIAPEVAGRLGKLITFSAYPGEKVVITGADPMNDGWTQSGNAWRHTWTQSLPAEPNNGTLADRPEFRREMVIVNGSVLKPVYSRSAVVPGTFYVEGTDVAPKAIYMRLSNDQSPSGNFVEAGYRSSLFRPLNARDDWCGGKYGFYRLVGLTFRHAVNNANWAAVCTGAKGSLVEEITVEWTNGTGIDVAGENIVLRGSRAISNGMRGIGGRCASCSIEYNETSENNWKEHAYGYSSSGIKLIYSKQTTIRHHLSVRNNGVGIWLDVDNHDNIIENSVALWNMGRGIMLEHGTVRTIVRNNVVYGTQLHPNEGTGIQTQAASHNTIVHNTIVGNEGYGIFIRVSPRNDDGYNKIFNNLLIGNATGGDVGHTEIRIDGSDLAHARTNTVNGNFYWPHDNVSSSTFMFKTHAGDFYRGNDISEWRGLISGDAAARVLDPKISQIKDMRSSNGWCLVTGSQAIGKGITLPSGIEVLTDIHGHGRPSTSADIGAEQFHDGAGDIGDIVEAVLGENGSVSVRQNGPDEWHTIPLKNVYVSPVVVMSPLSYNGGHPSTVRVRNVTSKSFEFQIDEWDYLDGRHAREDAHYVVFEAGRHQLGNGHEVEAGIVRRNSKFGRVGFTTSFSATPVVFSQIVTVNDARAAVTRQRNVKPDGFGLALQGEQADESHGYEQVAYVAITQGNGKIGTQAFSAGTAPRGVDHQFYAMGFGQSFSSSPVVLASMQSADGMHTATLRYQNLNGSGMEIKVEEEQSKDPETKHKKEAVGYLAIEGGAELSLSKASTGVEDQSSGFADGLPTQVELVGNYPNPFNPETTIRYALPEGLHVKLEVYDVLGRRVAVLVDQTQSAGMHEARFDAGGLASGTYVYRLEAGSYTKVTPMVLMK